MKKAHYIILPILMSVWLTATAHGQQSIGEILRDPKTNWRDPQQRALAVGRIRAIEVQELANARKLANAKGIPILQKGPNGSVRVLSGMDENGELVFITTTNANAAISSGANLLGTSPYNLNGAGLTVGIWEAYGRPLSSHVEFNAGGSSRVTVKDGASPIEYHATHVAGTIGASGVNATAKGMAPEVMLDCYDYANVVSEVAAVAATAANQFDSKLYLSNHSYASTYGWYFANGYNTWGGTGTDQNAYDINFGRYQGDSSNLDSIAYNAPYYLAFYSAGNDRSNNPGTGSTVSIGGSLVTYDPAIHPAGDGNYRSGFETIGVHGVAKNVMTIGAANDAVTSGVRNPSVGTISGFSSTGPCDDGRIKPDIVANGVGVISTSWDGGYVGMDGTSMSSPSACGSAALLVERYRELFGATSAMRASTLKGLLIHTATDIGNAGPDYTYGWGYMNVKAANDLLTNAATYPNMLCLREDQVSTATPMKNHDFFWDGSSPIRVTLSWTDPAGSTSGGHDNRTPKLVNNLHVKLIAPDNTEYFPFVMPFVGTWTVASMSLPATTGVNNTDNVEQVMVNAPGQNGKWRIEVSHAGVLTNGVQDYGLLVSGSNSNPEGKISFNTNNFSVNEGAGAASITVNRVGGDLGAVSVNYGTSNGTALAGSDYSAVSGTLNWANGDSASKIVSIPITNDSIHESAQEALSITLSNAIGISITGTNPATLTILENDNQLPVVNAGSDQVVILGPVAWSPSALAPALWLDAADASSITLNGSTVSQWRDKSVNGRHATQATATAQPTLISGGLNSKNILRFDGTTDFFNGYLDFMAGKDHSVFVVTKPTTYSNIYGAANGGAGASSLHVGFVNSTTYRMNYWSNDWNGAITANFQAGSANLLNYVWLSGTSKQIFANGKSEGTKTPAGVIGAMSGGGRIGNVAGLGYYGGDIAEFIALDKNLAAADRQTMEGYLAHKWGTQGLLDVSHPHKSLAPSYLSVTASLNATASDGDNDPLAYSWSLVAGPSGASVTLGSANALSTSAAFSVAGIYTLRLSVTDGYTTVSDDIMVTVFDEGTIIHAVNFQTDGTADASLSGNTSQSVVAGGNATAVAANAPSGYHFVKWTQGAAFYSAANPLTATNVVAAMTLTAHFAKNATLSIADDGLIFEQAEDGESIVVTLADAIFVDPLTPSNWSISGQPGGVSIGSVTRVNNTTARILLSGNSITDYDSNITGMTVTCAAVEVVDAITPLSDNSGVTLTANNDAESIEIVDDGWILEGAENGELISVILNGGTFANTLNAANWTVSNLPAGVGKGTITRVNSNVATIALSGNRSGSYTGSNITNVTVSCSSSEYSDSTGNGTLSDNSGVVLRALSSSSASLQDGLNGYSGTRDTYIDYSNPGTSYGGATAALLNNRTSPTAQRKDKHGFLYFDLGSIPPGTVITGATVELTDNGGDPGGFGLYEATASWSEAGATYTNDSGKLGSTVASPVTFATGSAPGTAGSAISLALNAQGISKLQGWINNASSNNGFSLTTTTTDSTTPQFRTREHTTLAHRPKLVLTFAAGGSSAPEINVQGNALSIVSGDNTPASADHTDFGYCLTGGPTVVRTFSIQNKGNSTLTLGGTPRVAISGAHAGDFSVSSLPLSSISAGATTTFAITFSPGAAGVRSATVSIVNNDGDESPYTFGIEGEGVVPVSSFTTWAGGAGFSADNNGDGISNGLAWVLGASNVSAGAGSLLPTSDLSDPNSFIFNYRLADAAAADSATSVTAEYSTNLNNWNTAIDNNTTVEIQPYDDAYGPGVDRVEVKISRDLAPTGKLFSRLKVNHAP